MNNQSTPVKAVAYCRVSTQEQGRSGLGLEAQRATIERIAKTEGIDVAAWFTEVQTGKGDDSKRPQLQAAMAKARELGAPVMVAKLDRLSRNVHFISGLMVEGVAFRCCDLPPEAPKFMLHIFAVLAEWERDMISERTKAALAAARVRGVKLGSPGRDQRAAQRALAQIEAPLLMAAGTGTLQQRAERLNRQGYVTATGKPFRGTTVQRMDRRAKTLI